MKRLGLLGIYEWGLYAVLLLIVAHAPIAVFFGTLLPDYEMLVKAWKEIILTSLAAIAVAEITRRKLWEALVGDLAIQLSLAFIALHLALIVIFGGDIQTVVAGLMIDLRFVAMFLLMYALIVLRPEALRRTVKVVAAGAAIVIGFGILQITVLPDDVLRPLGYSTETITPFTTIDRNPDFVRINSTLRGPNPLGALAVVYTALAVAYLVRRRGSVKGKWQIVVAASIAASAAVVFASYSRSAYVALAASIAAVVVIGYGRISKRIAALAAVSLVLLIGGLSLLASTDWYSNVILHEDPESTVVAKSNDGHVDSLTDGARRFAAQPFGAGIGSTGSASLYDTDTKNDVIIENYYFFVAHESGWLGVALFIGLFVLILTRLWRQRGSWLALGMFGSGIGLAVIAILLPVWADETVALIWWGLVGAVLASTSGIIGNVYAKRTR